VTYAPTCRLFHSVEPSGTSFAILVAHVATAEISNEIQKKIGKVVIGSLDIIRKCKPIGGKSTRHSWSRGMMSACHAGDPGSIPGECTLFFFASCLRMRGV
jgi:hypothetical protein